MNLDQNVTIVPEARAWLDGMKAELQSFYAKIGKDLTEAELTLEIERRFGERLFREVATLHGVFQGTCLLIAAEVAKEAETKTGAG